MNFSRLDICFLQINDCFKILKSLTVTQCKEEPFRYCADITEAERADLNRHAGVSAFQALHFHDFPASLLVYNLTYFLDN